MSSCKIRDFPIDAPKCVSEGWGGLTVSDCKCGGNCICTPGPISPGGDGGTLGNKEVVLYNYEGWTGL